MPPPGPHPPLLVSRVACHGRHTSHHASRGGIVLRYGTPMVSACPASPSADLRRGARPARARLPCPCSRCTPPPPRSYHMEVDRIAKHATYAVSGPPTPARVAQAACRPSPLLAVRRRRASAPTPPACPAYIRTPQPCAAARGVACVRSQRSAMTWHAVAAAAASPTAEGVRAPRAKHAIRPRECTGIHGACVSLTARRRRRHARISE